MRVHGRGLPRGTLALLAVGEGCGWMATNAPGRELRLTPGEVDLERQLEAARKGMKRYRNALRELAK